MKKIKNSNNWLIVSLILFLIFICSAISVVILIFRAPNIIRTPNYDNDFGEKKVITENNDITGIDIIDVKCEVGEIDIEKYSGEDVSIEYTANEDAKVELQKANGILTIDVMYGRMFKLNLDILQSNNVRLKIKIPESYTKDITVDNNMGDMYAKGKFTNAKLISDLGDIESEMDVDYLEVDISAGDSKISGKVNSSRVESSYGEIYFKPSLGEKGEHTLKADVGDIFLELAPDSDVRVEARTALGDIKNQFDFTNIIKDERKDLASKFLASNKKGQNRIVLKSDTGDINIK